ncbi:MAG: glycosyltransferase [Flavipsychrobacter sp.]|nr:glycosyltransferase [Flavipsychrobacter sp.]
MKIALIGPAHPLRGGGISTFNERLATELQTEGHDVTIYSFSLQYPSFLFPGKSQFTYEPAPAGLNIKSIINSINPLSWINVGNLIKKDRPDLVIVRYWMPFMGPCLGTILRIVNQNKHTRILCIADNIIPHEKRPGDLPFTKYFIKPVHTFIAMSRDVLKDLKTLTDKPATFVPHPLYDNYGAAVPRAQALAQLKLPTDKKYMLFFGFIRKYKGLDILLEAMSDERLKASGVELIVAGEFYGDEDFYTNIIKQHGLEQKVHMYTSFIPNEEVTLYFSAADVIVQPYRSATQSGITQVAYHFEKPMIVTNVGGLAEVVPNGETGYVTTPEPAAIADALLQFFTPGSIPNLDANLKREKAKYSWDVFVQQLLQTAGF